MLVNMLMLVCNVMLVCFIVVCSDWVSVRFSIWLFMVSVLLVFSCVVIYLM